MYPSHCVLTSDSVKRSVTDTFVGRVKIACPISVGRGDPIIEESIDRDRQRDAHDARECGIVRSQRRQTVEEGGSHGEILCSEDASRKAESPHR